MKRSEYAFRSAHSAALAQCGPPRLSESPREYEARIIERMTKNQEARLKGLVKTLALSGQIEGVR